MGWKECCVMDERMRFVARILDGEKMSAVCREFGVSRKTGYKIYNRYKENGLEALKDQSRRPGRFGNKLPEQMEKYILFLKHEKPSWGAPKLRERFIRKLPDIKPPAISTIHAVLDRHGLVTPRGRRRRNRATGTVLSKAVNPNDLWCADYKGQFMLGHKQYCYPLTITDQVSRFLLACESLENTKEQYAFTVFERTFEEYGLPYAMRTDNGVPFASPNGLFNLSALSVWWLSLGIAIERIKPGHPQQNGRHERMHLTLKKETTKPPAENFLQQQAKFDDFQEEFNNERPHEALAMKFPAEVYRKSSRVYKRAPEIDYPFHDRSARVTQDGAICINGVRVYFGVAFAGHIVGLNQVADETWLVTFTDYDLGYFDVLSKRFEPLADPFKIKVSPMSPE